MGVTSKPGWGSTFWFAIPFLCAAEPPSEQWGLNEKRTSGGLLSLLDPVSDECDEDGGLQILLVDEDNVGRKVMAALLEQSGHSVTTTDNGQAMIQVVTEASFDVVLLETLLPSGGGDAFFATGEIRKMGYSQESLPILALTASVPRADYPELGLNDWLTKPMVIKDIQKAMTNAICNVGAKTTCTGSVFTSDDTFSTGIDCGGISLGYSLGRSHFTNASPPSQPRRGSFGSLHSAFSDQLEAVLGAPPPSQVIALIDKAVSVPLASLERSSSMNSTKSDRPPRMIQRRSRVEQ